MGDYDEYMRQVAKEPRPDNSWSAWFIRGVALLAAVALLCWWCVPKSVKPMSEKPDPPFSEAELRAILDYRQELERISSNLDRLAHEYSVADTDLQRRLGCNLTRMVQAEYFVSKTIPIDWYLSGDRFERFTPRKLEPGESLTPKETEDMYQRLEEERSK
jgi:hypothetical protein